CKENDWPFKVILLPSDCFRHYFAHEFVNTSIKILFIPDDIEGQFVFDPKTAIVKPVIANYINETLKQLKTESKFFHHSDYQKAWEQYNPARACKIISLLSV